MKEQPLVSIIIPTYNSEKTLPLCLKSIKKQTYKNIEIIVVDNHSTDKTIKIAKDYGAKIYTIGSERSTQKNYGALKASGKYVYFIDSDFVLHSRTVEECVQLAENGYDAVIVLNISYPKSSFIAKIRFYERLSYYGSGIYEAARFIRRDLFLKIGGFDNRLFANEDYDLHLRLLRTGARISRTKKSFEIHIGEPRSFKEFIVKNIYYGSNLKKYIKKNPNIKHIIPIRHTFFKKDYVAYVGRRWPLALLLIPLLKIAQAIAVQIGFFTNLNISPYNHYE